MISGSLGRLGRKDEDFSSCLLAYSSKRTQTLLTEVLLNYAAPTRQSTMRTWNVSCSVRSMPDREHPLTPHTRVWGPAAENGRLVDSGGLGESRENVEFEQSELTVSTPSSAHVGKHLLAVLAFGENREEQTPLPSSISADLH